MGPTLSFFLLTLFTTILVLVLVIWNRSVPNALAMARGFFFLSLVLSFASLLFVVLAVSGLSGNAGSDLLFRVLIYRAWLVIGTGTCSALVLLVNALAGRRSPFNRDATHTFVASPYLLKGICLSVAISFLSTEVGKLAHDADMRKFFTQSGYPIWFLYVIIAVETVGAIGLLVRKTVLPATLGLAVIMLGAIYTHARNRDPFSDSLEALHLLILLVCVLVIVLVQQKSWRQPTNVRP